MGRTELWTQTRELLIYRNFNAQRYQVICSHRLVFCNDLHIIPANFTDSSATADALDQRLRLRVPLPANIQEPTRTHRPHQPSGEPVRIWSLVFGGSNKTNMSLSFCCTVQTLVMLSGLLIVTSLKHTCAPIRLFNQRHLSGEDEAH